MKNKYAILETLLEDNPKEISMLQGRMIVDTFLNKKLQPSVTEVSKWTPDMHKYFKEKWEDDRRKEAEENIQNQKANGSCVEDIVEEGSELNENITANEIYEGSTNILH